MEENSGQAQETDFKEDKEFQALQQIISVLKNVDHEGRFRILVAVATFLKIDLPIKSAGHGKPDQEMVGSIQRTGFSEDTSMSPKDFMFEKQPQTDVERVACLAYYLTHYRDTPYFKTVDISILNTESAQPKFSNAAYSVNNAVKQGYLVPASKGQRQLSAVGEQFVRALPDRIAAMEAMVIVRSKKSSRKKTTKIPKAGD